MPAVLAVAVGLAAAPRAHADAPTAPTADDAAKQAAQALLTEGVAALTAKHYDQALDKFLAAYDKFPSPKILLDVGSTLRDMGRLADAANTYERYLEDPSTSAERVGEVKQLLTDLDQKVALLVVQVTPPGSDVSIDGGPWTTIGASLSTRVEAGAHVVRARKAGLQDASVNVTGAAGKRQEVALALQLEIGAETASTAPPPTPPGPSDPTATPAPANTNGWLITGPSSGRVRAHQGHSGTGATEGDVHVAAVGPTLDHSDDHAAIATTAAPAPEPTRIEGAVQARIDGKLRGAALAIGGAFDPTPEVQVEAALMLSKDLNGVIAGLYGGARYRFLDGGVHPLVGAGIPVFWSGGSARVGARVSGGVEVLINVHLSVLADLGYEHFFNAQSPYEKDLFVPILGVHGRM